MFLTRKCDYAVRMIRALAREKRLNVNDICEREELTKAFAYKIIKKLEKAGFVQGFRGSQGGYELNISLGQLTLLAVFQAVDSNISIISCPEKGKACSRNSEANPCKVHMELCRIDRVLQAELSVRSLKEILEESPI